MKGSEVPSIVEEYTRVRPTYEAYTKKIEELLKALLEESNILVHSVTSRTKDIDGFSKKLEVEGKEYKNFSDVTDLSGVRIICYFADQVDKVAEIIGGNFTVHHELSIDKRNTLDPDRFGYLSLHYVVELSKERARLPEYERFKNLLCEVQIRSILQHAWAEIEHDLGYKSSIEVPRDIRRRFSRLAGLLELADDEFDGIKEDLSRYADSVAEQISFAPEKILIDKVSLEHYLKNSLMVKEINNAIADLFKARIMEDIFSLPKDIAVLAFFNITKIDELDKALKENKEKIIAFAKEMFGEKKEEQKGVFVDLAISVSYLFYVLAGSSQKHDEVIEFLKFSWSRGSKEIQDPKLAKFAKEIIETYKKISS